MSFIPANLKYLRKLNGYTQQQLADEIGVKRAVIGAYEEARAEPPVSTLIKLSEVFQIPVDKFIKMDIGADPRKLFLPAQGNGSRVLAITVDRHDQENIELVPQKAAAGYLNGYADPEYIKELPKFQLPNLPRNATYRAFEISGDSMLPLQPGTVIIGEYLEKAEDVKNGRTYILVTQREGVVYKRVFNYVAEKGVFYLVSDNKTYAPYEIPAEEILEIWQARAFISNHFPEPDPGDRMSMDQLTQMVINLQQEITRMKDQ